jgi:hypothetical protein
MGFVGQRHAPAALLSQKRPGTHGRSGHVWKITPPPGFGPRTVQPVASDLTDYAIPPHT